jgi:hypothetical protein
MNTNEPTNPKTNTPDSDQTARTRHADLSDDRDDIALADLQTSNKSGKHSSVEKLAASRPEYGSGRGAQKVPGAFGNDADGSTPVPETAPDTGQFRCSDCGQQFNTAVDISAHEPECQNAKASKVSDQS